MLQIAYWLLIIGLSLCAGDSRAGHYRKSPPAECKTIDPGDFTFPPITFIRLPFEDSTRVLVGVEVWLRLRVDDDGKPHDVAVIWCNVDDSSYEQKAVEAVSSRIFEEHRLGVSRPDPLLHVVKFRPEHAMSDRSDGNVPDTAHQTEFGWGMLIAPEMTFQVTPQYPLQPILDHLVGSTWVKSLVSSEGNVVESAIHKSSGDPYLDYAALLASYHNKYKPGMQEGKPVAVWVTYRVDFKMKD